MFRIFLLAALFGSQSALAVITKQLPKGNRIVEHTGKFETFLDTRSLLKITDDKTKKPLSFIINKRNTPIFEANGKKPVRISQIKAKSKLKVVAWEQSDKESRALEILVQ